MNMWNNGNGPSSKDLFSGMSNERQIIRQSQKEEPVLNPTLILGLITEEDCFKAIQELGDAKTSIKNQIKQLTMARDKMDTSNELAKSSAALQRVHNNQLIIINDVCRRFHVIHPEIDNPTEEMLKVSRPYWDWYNELFEKVFGHKPPSVIKKSTTSPVEGKLKEDL